MALASEMMGGGLSAGQAQAINGVATTGIAAAGSTLSTATALTSGNNLVSTVSSGTGVRLPDSQLGDEVMIYNDQGSNALLVYPPTSSGTINQLSAGTGMSLAVNTAVKIKKITATRWIGWLSA